MQRIERSPTLKSMYDMENPRRHMPVEQILEKAGVEPLDGQYVGENHGNGYASITPTATDGE